MPTRPTSRRLSLATALVVAALALAACGSTSHDPYIARVGSSTITQQELLGTMTALAPEHLVPDPPSYSACIKRLQQPGLVQASSTTLREECRQQYQTLQRQALALLISWQWLLGEAAARHLEVSSAEVQARLREDGASSTAAGASSGEEALLAKAELSGAKLRQATIDAEPRLTRAQLLDYYHRHIRSFVRPKLRYIELAENYPSAAAAAKVRSEVVAGRVKLTNISIPEILKGTYIANGRHTRQAARRAIFSAKVHVLSQPLNLNGSYSFFEITRIVPAHLKPFAQVERSLRAMLEGERQERALEQAVGAWRQAWTARTNCAPGYVIQKCRQYRGAKASESQLVFN